MESDHELTYAVVGRAYRVYNELGYGFLESGYVGALIHACRKQGIRVERERCVPLYFDGEVVANYRADLVINSRILVEVKSRPQVLAADIKQVWNYLRCTDLEVALLLNFGPNKLVWRRYSHPNSLKRKVMVNKEP